MFKKNFVAQLTAVAAFVLLPLAMTSCGGSSDSSSDDIDTSIVQIGDDGVCPDVEMKEFTIGPKTYNIAVQDDLAQIYEQNVDRSRCFFVVSKKEYRLYVYEARETDTALVAHFPVCYAKYPEAKTQSGDMRTPECTMDEPFTISQIQDASEWSHDFGDGRGSILSYGSWFMRLVTPGFTGVGIHGSTNNAESVPGRDSEGCIRLRDNDLIQLHDLYAAIDMKVVVKGINENKLPFEVHAQQALADRYVSPKKGNPLLSDSNNHHPED